ncbi:MAG: DUF4268 domain-containing protein [Acidimicrobiaceae bacterium]|nr:DUF4268 domain-containing protein [Acidimicrobiaceae bacterium]
MASTEQQPQPVDVREVWPHEAHDFTPWLARNLDLLGKELGLKLDFVACEHPVGPYFLDILAKESGTERPVAIENQLEWSDFGHLAQLFVYATGCKAKTAIWIATGFRYELARVLHRLNKWTVDGVRFYAVRVEVTRATQGSEPERRFRKVVYPGGWDQGATLPRHPPESPDVGRFREFFELLIAQVDSTALLRPRPSQRFDHTGRHFRSSHNPGLSYAVSLEGTNDAWVTLHIEADDKESTKRIFDALNAERSQIESAIPIDTESEWDWRRHDRWGFSSINVRRDGSISDPPEVHDKIRTWMLDLLRKFQEAFDPRVAAILSEEA